MRWPWTHALLGGSPAFEAGDPGFTTPPNFDQRGSGYPRVAFSRIDIGAYEAQSLPTLLVDTNLDESDGVFSAGDFSLREAIELANAFPGADTINFSGALSGSTILLTLGQLSITDDVTITGLGADVLTVDAQGSSRVLNVINADADISGLTLTGGNVTGDGGGIYSDGGDLTLTAVTISGNTATSDGGGLRHRGSASGNLSITDSTISDNVADSGGGIFVATSSDLTTTKATITGSTISGNTATRGGGIRVNNGLTVIEHSTITLNEASGDGDGVWNYGDSVTRSDVGSSIISGNVGDDDVFNYTFTNPFVSLGYNLIGGGNDTGSFGAAGDQTGVFDPMLGALADNGGPTLTHALLGGSPALDGGDPAALPGAGAVPLFDQRGNDFGRVQNGRIDIGAFEVRDMLSADFDSSGFITGFDFLLWQIGFGTTAPNATKADGDADNDLDVDTVDLGFWEDQYGLAEPLAALEVFATSESVESAPLNTATSSTPASVAAPLLANGDLVDVALAVALAEEADGVSGKREFVAHSPPLEFFSTEPILRSDSVASPSISSSATTSTPSDDERHSPEGPSPWEDALDEAFASVFE